MCGIFARLLRRRGRRVSPRSWSEREIRQEWDVRLASATLSCERDELNDIFGRVLP
jgi:hypothetical protein